MIRAGKWLIVSLLMLVSLTTVLLFLLVGTGVGAEFAVRKAIAEFGAQPQMQLSVKDVSGTLLQGLRLKDVRFSQPDGSLNIEVKQLDFTWQPMQLRHSRLVLNSLTVDGVSVTQTSLEPADSTIGIDIESILTPLFSLPVAIDIATAEFSNVDLSLGDSRYAGIQASFQLRLDQKDLTIDQFEVEYLNATLRGSLALAATDYRLQTDLHWRGILEQIEYAGSLRVSGELEQLQLEHQLINPVRILSVGEVRPNFAELSQTQFNLLNSFDQMRLDAFDQPAISLANGEVKLSGSISDIAIQAGLLLEYENLAPAKVDAVLQYESNELSVQRMGISSPEIALTAVGKVALQPLQALQGEFQWDLNKLVLSDRLGDSALANSLGTLSGAGTVRLQDSGGRRMTSVHLDTLKGTLNQHPLQVNGDLSLIDNKLESLNLVIAADANSVSLVGTVDPNLSLKWQLQGPALGQLLPGLTGEVAGNGVIEGMLTNPVLNGLVSGAGISYVVDDQRYELGSIRLTARHESAQNHISLKLGNVNASVLDATIEDLALTLSGTLEQHTLAFSAQSDMGTASLSATGGISADTWQGELSKADFNTRYGHWLLDDAAQLLLSSSRVEISRHCWAYLNSPGVNLCSLLAWQKVEGVSGDLYLQDWPLSYLNNEQALRRYGNQTLMNSFLTRPAGIAELLDTYSLNFPGRSVVDGRLSLSAKLQQFTGTGAGSIVVNVMPNDLVMGLSLSEENELEVAPADLQRFEFSDIVLSARNEQSSWYNDLSFTVSQQEPLGLSLQGRVTGALAVDQNRNLSGNLELDFANLAWLESVYPEATDVVGELYAAGKIGGDLQRPIINAEVNVKQAGFRLPEAGLNVKEINLNLVSDSDNTLTLVGSASSGPDSQIKVNATATTPWLPQRNMNVTVVGERFQILNTPKYAAEVSPNLTLNLENNVFSVRGEVVMPVLDISLPGRLSGPNISSVDVSPDVIVVEGQRSGAQRKKGLLETIPVVADINLVLGDQVRFRGYGLDLTLAGELALEQDLDRPLLAHGELLIPRGSYQIYGQALNAENGKLIFFGNPRNPVLDIRATRATSPGTTAIVGIHLGGSIRNIEGELFSTPALPDQEVLAILVTGKSFGNASAQDGDVLLTAIANLGIEKGQGITKAVRSGLGLDSMAVTGGSNFRESSLGLGKYLSPNLLMRYDIGLFDRQSVLGLEYSLTEHIRFEVETGISQSVDLTYAIERN